MTDESDAENPQSGYTKGQIDLLKALFRTTRTTRTAYDILLAAHDSNRITNEVIDEAREVLYDEW